MVEATTSETQRCDNVVYQLGCTGNNKACRILQCFLKAVEDYGLPSRLRSDKGKENVLVADYMLGKKGKVVDEVSLRIDSRKTTEGCI